jgi:hypothetical protein
VLTYPARARPLNSRWCYYCHVSAGYLRRHSPRQIKPQFGIFRIIRSSENLRQQPLRVTTPCSSNTVQDGSRGYSRATTLKVTLAHTQPVCSCPNKVKGHAVYLSIVSAVLHRHRQSEQSNSVNAGCPVARLSITPHNTL